MSAGRGDCDPNIPGNRTLFLSAGVPNLDCRNLASTAAAGNSSSIASPALFSSCSTSVLNTMQEISSPQAVLSSPISRTAEQHDGPSIQPSLNIPAGCTQVPINIFLFHKQSTQSGLRAPLPSFHSFTPAPALPDVSEGASIQLVESNLLSLGRTSNIVAGDMTINPSHLATPDKYNSGNLWLNGLYDEASKAESRSETSKLQQLETAVFCDSHNELESVIPANTLETRVQNSRESTDLFSESTTGDNVYIYEPMQKRPKTKINQSEHLSTPAVSKEKTRNQIEMRIVGAEKTEMSRSEETPAQKMKTRRKKHRPKVIRENKLVKVQNPGSTPEGKMPNKKIKRSYVRKKKNPSSLEKCSDPVIDQSISGIPARSCTASVRRSLQFEPEEQGVQADHSSRANSHHNYKEPIRAQSSLCSESEVQIGHGLQLDMENSPGGFAFGMSLRMNKLLDDYIHLPEATPKPTEEVLKASSGSFSTELTREQDNLGRTCEPVAKGKSGLCIEDRVVTTVVEGNKKYLELNYSEADGFLSSARSLHEMESAGSQMSKVSGVENHMHHNDGELSLPGTRDSVMRAAAEMLAFCQAGGIKKKRSSRVRRNSFFPVMDLENNTIEASTRLPQPCMNALYESSCIKFMTKKRSQKARPHWSSSIQPNDELKNRTLAGSIVYGGSNGPKISEETSPYSSHQANNTTTTKPSIPNQVGVGSSPQTLDNKIIKFDTYCEVSEERSANTSADELKNRTLAGNIVYGGSNGPKISEETSPYSSHQANNTTTKPSIPNQVGVGSSPQTLDNKIIKFDTYCEVSEEKSANTSADELKNRTLAGSIFYGGSNGPKISEETSPNSSPQANNTTTTKPSILNQVGVGSSPQTLDNKVIKFDTYCEVSEERSANTLAGQYMDCLQGVASKLKHLNLNTEQVHRTEMHLSLTTPAVISFGRTDGLSNALVPYGGGVMVPHERPLQLVKKQRPRAKVDLDYETTRVWNLLMGKAAEPDGTDVEKERWWQQEREVFEGRANSFIARMRLVQGDRRFSPWKGSVVDSVVGVFLTQNVADHLSSSAYMALAASFPSRSVDSHCKDAATSQDNEQTTSTSALGEKNMFSLSYNGARPDLEVGCERNVCNDQGAQLPDFSSVALTHTELLQQIQIQKEISSSQNVTLETISSRLSLSFGMPRNFVCGSSAAAYHKLGNNFDHGRSLAGNNATTSGTECQRIPMAAISDYGFKKSSIPSSATTPIILTVDPQQLSLRNEPNVSSTSSKSPSDSASPILKNGMSPPFIPFNSYMAEWSSTADTTLNSSKTSIELPVKLHHDKRTSFEATDSKEHESLFSTCKMTVEATRKEDEYTSKSGFTSYYGVQDTAAQASRPKKTRSTSKKNAENFDWDKLRRQARTEGQMKKRSFDRRDSVDWEAVRCADVQRISHAIRERGMNNILAERIQNFLNRLVRDHGSIDLEWLRDIPPDSAKDYLLSIRGLGLKSVECVRLLTLHHLAFPVDTNVGRICVRLGWVPIQPLPESLQLHLLELYPILETIQKYLWPRLCKLDQQTLYELHYQMITFGKVFCTKSKPNCNACPMRSECKHFASAFASARLALPAPQDKSLVKSSNQFAFQNSSTHTMNSTHLPHLEGTFNAREFIPKNSEPIIEEPASPREEETLETLENDIEDFYEDGEIPTIKLNMEAFAQNLENCMKESSKELQSDDIAKALVAISTEAASIPVPKLKNVQRLRTEHYVYELPDSHSLLQQLGLDQREPDDPTPYLLAIWTPDEIKEIRKAPKTCCDPPMENGLCTNEMCHSCIAEQENQSRYVRGTILVPCRTAMRGSFPLNGTYFQVNEVFADHTSSHNPIHVEREQLWNLQRRMVFFGTSVPTIFKGLTTEEIQQCFWRGFVCVRGFDMDTRAPRPLCPHLHVVARPKSRKTAATEQVL